MNQDTQTPEEMPPARLGELIKTAREDKGMSSAALAAKLNLGAAVVDNLEAEQFAELPAPAFVRGYLRVMARELELEEGEVLSLYAKCSATEPDLGSTSSATRQHKASDPVMVWGSVLILLALVALLLVWGVRTLTGASEDAPLAEGIAELPAASDTDNMSLPVAPAAVEGVPAEPAASNAAPDASADPAEAEAGQAAQPEAEQAADAPADSTTSVALELGDAAETAADPATDPAATPVVLNLTAPAGKQVLKIQVRGDSWADIRDASGFKLVYGLLDKRNGELVLQGKAPFKVFVGDAAQISLEYQGKPFDFSEFVRANNVAKFSVE